MTEELQVVEGVEESTAANTSEPVEEVKQETVESESEDAQETEEEAHSDKSEEGEPKELSEADKIRQAMQKRIDRKHAAHKRDQERVNELQNEVQRLSEQLNQVKPQENPEPKYEDYDTVDEYIEAKAEFAANKRIQEAEQQKQLERVRKAQEEQYATLQKQFTEKVESFSATNPDYAEREQDFKDVWDGVMSQKGVQDPTVQAVNQIIMESQATAHLIHELGGAPELIEDLSKMSAVDAARELFKLENALLNKKEARPESKPKPIKSLTGKGSAKRDLSQKSGAEILAQLGIK